MSVVVKDLLKVYGNQHAVNNISFSAQKGEILGFLGPNGAGKSTTMKIATCFLPPSAGTVEVVGFDVLKDPISVRKNLGYLPEHNPLYLDMYVHEYLQFIGSMHSLKGRNLKSRVGEMVELCGLVVEQHKKIAMLSKGYRQRVGLAQALIHNPSVLILDEPTTGLDPNQIVEIRNLIKTISENKTVIFSTHIMQEVQALCDRVVIINKGDIVANDLVDNIKGMQAKSILVLELRHPIDLSELKALDGVEEIRETTSNTYEISSTAGNDLRSAVFKCAAASNWDVSQIYVKESSLEEVFHQLTK